MNCDVSKFFENFAERQDADELMTGRSYEFDLTEDEVKEIFGEVPPEDSAIRLGIALTQVAEDKFELVVKID